MCDRAVISARYHETHCLHVGKGQRLCNQCSKCFWTDIAERVLRSLLMRTFRVVYPLVSIFLFILTHWGRVTHICVSKLTIIGSDNGLSPGRRQAIIWTNAGILLIRPLGTIFNEMLIEIHTFSFKKMHLKMSSAKWRLFCLGLNELTDIVMDYYRDRSTLIEAWYGSYREWCRIIHPPYAVDFLRDALIWENIVYTFFYYFPTLRWCRSPIWTTGVIFNWHRQYHGFCWPGGQGLNIDKYSSFSNIRFSLLTWAEHIGRSVATAQTHVLTPEIVCDGHDVTNTKTYVEIFIVVMAW